MATLRIKGRPLAAVRALTANPLFASALWAATNPDFGVPALKALPPSARGPFEDQAYPLAGSAPHRWQDADLGTPTASRPTVDSLHAAFVAGRATPSEVLEQALAAHEAGRFGKAHRSPYVALDPDVARAAAAASTERYAAGRPLSPLDGIPVPVKDQQHVRGLPTRGGTSTHTQPVDADGWAVQRLRAAGALVHAKTHATEWGLNPWGCNRHARFPRNVWSTDHGAGGSSTGSGVAVALGHTPVALGSDGGGSIRIPSCLNGVFGLKPSFIRIGRSNDQWGTGSVGTLGPIGGTVADLVHFLEATSGVDPNDPTSTMAPDGHRVAPSWHAALGRGVKGCRIGVVASEWQDADPRIAELGRRALAALEADGAILVDVTLPLAEVAPAVGALVIASETTASLADDFRAHGPTFGDELAIILRLMSRLSAQEFLAACRVRSALRREVAQRFATQVDLLALPTTATAALPYGLHEDDVDILCPPATAAMTRFAFLANLTGLPAGQVPTGRVDGLPVGLQLVGDAWDEASVIAGMAHAERQGWTELGRPDDFLALGPG